MGRPARALSPTQRDTLLRTLEARFAQHPRRHPGVAWAAVRARLDAAPHALWSLHEMERTGGEPDVVALDGGGDGFRFCDCAAESPAGRRSLCYDGEGWASRKEHRPEGNAVDMAASMGIALLTPDEYRELQRFGAFDTKTSSWLLTPPAIRAHGGALFGDRRYDAVFVYHNGAASYYAARGFRGWLQV